MTIRRKSGESGTTGYTDSDEDNKANIQHVCFTAYKPTKGCTWYIDSGATSYMTSDRTFFTELRNERVGETIKIANGDLARVEGVGSGALK